MERLKICRCGNYSRAETNQGRKLLIFRRFFPRKLFKGGNYSRKYGIWKFPHFPLSKKNSFPGNYLVFLLISGFFQACLNKTHDNNLTRPRPNLICHETQIGGITYRISANSFRGNYSFLNLALCTVLWPLVTVHKSVETIQGRKLFKSGNYSRKYSIYLNWG